ncbi:hypothetical protein [Bradyrhizobium sp. NP1]|uniref:hypothetical protein n=1 Tax=Bradyrhizobium sp. NP1 TaxID=3049772 RepID=UPI0025A52391|nr:hypothetical protein [Bradyrhizobium sp. NP1]WJR75928.1 hypothetical protein QOU61_24530 [Bradyrhizobium sp. NP1]
MRQTISGLVAAIAVMTAGAAPAMACGYAACAPCATAYYSPCGWGFEHLANPETQYYGATGYYPTTQYYYVNQGPTYSGPGAFAPYPTYQENSVAYARPYYYGAGAAAPAVYPYRWRRHYHAWRRPYHSYRYGWHRYGYGPRYHSYHRGYPVLRRYY